MNVAVQYFARIHLLAGKHAILLIVAIDLVDADTRSGEEAFGIGCGTNELPMGTLLRPMSNRGKLQLTCHLGLYRLAIDVGTRTRSTPFHPVHLVNTASAIYSGCRHYRGAALMPEGREKNLSTRPGAKRQS